MPLGNYKCGLNNYNKLYIVLIFDSIGLFCEVTCYVDITLYRQGSVPVPMYSYNQINIILCLYYASVNYYYKFYKTMIDDL